MMPIWLQITLTAMMIIVTLTAPTLAEIVKFRINQPKTIPDPNQPKNRILKVIAFVLRVCGSPFILPPLFIATMFVNLFMIWRLPGPLTPGRVLVISTSISGILFGCLYMLTLQLTQCVRELLSSHIGTSKSVIKIAEVMRESFSSPDEEPPQGRKSRAKKSSGPNQDTINF